MFPFFRFILFNPGVFSRKFLVRVWRVVSSDHDNRFQTEMDKVYNYPFSDQNSAKTIPSGVANTCMAQGSTPPVIFLLGTTCPLIFVERLLGNVN